jgi:hypothetical protein
MNHAVAHVFTVDGKRPEDGVKDPRIIRHCHVNKHVLVTTDKNLRYTHVEELKKTTIAVIAAESNRSPSGVGIWVDPLIAAKADIERKLKKFQKPWCARFSRRLRPAIRLLFELYALALRNPQAYPGVLADPLAYWQKLTERASIPAKPDAVEATLLLAATRGLLLDLCATGDRARVERAMEALAQFVEWRVTSTEMMGREPKELNGG